MKHHDGSTTENQAARSDRAEPTVTGTRQTEVTETPGKHSSRSDQDRVRDALEDDEVMEFLRTSRRSSP